jgi:SAM-dependent methyltransferase
MVMATLRPTRRAGRDPGAVDSFWRERIAAHGHTGWADPYVYAYDQLERLRVVAWALDEVAARGGRALDFGCGTGDFSRLLLGRDFEVCGYDPYLTPRLEHPRFVHAARREELPFAPCSVDLVLSVTVLDHLLEEPALRRAIDLLRDQLRAGGRLLLLEYALDSADDRTPEMRGSSYQAFRTHAEWIDLMSRRGLAHEGSFAVPHPKSSPSQGYRIYRRRPLVRIVRRLDLPRRAPGLSLPLLRGAATSVLSRGFPALPHPAPSPLKLMRFVAR